MYIHVAGHFRSGFNGDKIQVLRRLGREGSPERLSRSLVLAWRNVATACGEYTLHSRVREIKNNNNINKNSNYSVGTIPRGGFCEQSSQKTREVRREIMQSMISVHRGACNCEGTEQLPKI